MALFGKKKEDVDVDDEIIDAADAEIEAEDDVDDDLADGPTDEEIAAKAEEEREDRIVAKLASKLQEAEQSKADEGRLAKEAEEKKAAEAKAAQEVSQEADPTKKIAALTARRAELRRKAIIDVDEEAGIEADEISDQIAVLRAEAIVQQQVAPVASQSRSAIGERALAEVDALCDDTEKQEVRAYLQEMKWDASELANPQVREVVMSVAGVRAANKSGKKNARRIPGAESATATSATEIAPHLQGEMAKIKRAVESVGGKFDPNRIMKKIERA